MEEAGRPNDAIDVLYSVNLVDPLDIELHGTLGDLLMDNNRAAEALREYSVMLDLDPHDKANAWFRMGRANNALGNTDLARIQLLEALDIAPNFRPAQRLLLDLSRAGADDQTDRD